MAELAPYLFGVVLTILAVFLVLLVLVQRGRGGGLTGALGGVGGSSAFGAKAGDVFTKITVVAASIWIVICVGAAYWASHRGDALGNAGPLLTPGTGAASTDIDADNDPGTVENTDADSSSEETTGGSDSATSTTPVTDETTDASTANGEPADNAATGE